jgi:hypothetical protein
LDADLDARAPRAWGIQCDRFWALAVYAAEQAKPPSKPIAKT